MQVWSLNSLGGFWAAPKLSKQIRNLAQPMYKFRQFVKTEPGYAKKQGDSMLIDIVSDTDDTGASSPISETEKVPETKVTIKQVTVTAYEYGRKIPYTGKLEDFSEVDVNNQYTIALRNSMAKALDKACAAEFVKSAVTLVPTGTTSNKTQLIDTGGAPTSVATRNLAFEDLIEAKAYLSQVLKAPKYDGENYIMIGNSYTAAAFQKDPSWTEAKNYGDPGARFTGEIGKINGIRFIEENNYFQNFLGTTSYRGIGVIFGMDAVIQAVAQMEELRSDIPTDMGRSKAIGWYALLGFKLLWTTALAGECRTMLVTSL